MDSPLITVVIPVYNRKAFLEEAVNSVLGQKYGNIEIIVVDDGSRRSEGAGRLGIRDPRIYYIYCRNGGVSRARNVGIKLARGSWIALLDSDDLWRPRKLEKQVRAIQENPNITLVYTDEIWYLNGRHRNQSKRHQKSSGDLFARSLELCLISPSSVLFRKSVFCDLGGFDVGFPVCEDYDLWLRWTARYPVLFIDEKLTVKRGGHEDQLSRSRPAFDLWRVRSIMKLIEEGELDRGQETLARQTLSAKSLVLFRGALRHRNFEILDELMGRDVSRDWSFSREMRTFVRERSCDGWSEEEKYWLLVEIARRDGQGEIAGIAERVGLKLDGPRLRMIESVSALEREWTGLLRDRKVHLGSLFLVLRLTEEDRMRILRYMFEKRTTFARNNILIGTFHDFRYSGRVDEIRSRIDRGVPPKELFEFLNREFSRP